MKNIDMIRLLNEIDDDLIEGANPDNISCKRRKRPLRLSVIAVCVVCVLIVAVAVIIPLLQRVNIVDPGDVGGTGTSSSQKPGTNDKPPIIYSPSSTGVKDSYEDIKEIVNAYLGNNTLTFEKHIVNKESLEAAFGDYVYTVKGGDVTAYLKTDRANPVATYKLYDKERYLSDMYLSRDGKSLTVFYEQSGEKNNIGYVTTLDLTDINNINVKDSFSYKGGYVSYGILGDDIVLLTYYNIEDSTFLDGYIPSFDTGEGYKTLPLGNIVVPEQLQGTKYMVATKISGEAKKYSGSISFLDFDGGAYVAENNIYVGRTYPTEIEDRNTVTRGERTEIARVEHTGTALAFKHIAVVEGKVVGINEYNGILRVATSIRLVTQMGSIGGSGTGESITTLSANLYCIKIGDMSIVGLCQGFNKNGEEIGRVSFDKERAYGFIKGENVNPVCVFDLSNSDDITYTYTKEAEN